jgi:hypothetical protein
MPKKYKADYENVQYSRDKPIDDAPEHPSINWLIGKITTKKHFKTVSPQAVFECLEFEEDDAEGNND